MTNKLEAPGYRIVVKLQPVEEVTKGGLVLPGDYLKKVQQATTIAEVVAIGPSCWWDVDGGKPWCKVGDTIVINKYSWKDAPEGILGCEDEELYKTINDKDVINVIRES